MERNAVIAVVISIAILILYQEVVIKRFYPPPPPEELQNIEPQSPSAAQNPPPDSNDAAPADGGTASTEGHSPALGGRSVTVDTPLYIATFNTVGARLSSFKLKHYRTTVQADSPPQETIVPGQAGEVPVGIELRGNKDVKLISDASADYSVDGSAVTLQGNEKGDLDFHWNEGPLTLHKRFTFHADSYEVDGQVEAAGAPAAYNELLLSWSKLADGVQSPLSEVVFDHAVLLNGKKLEQHQFKDMQNGNIVEGDIRWIGYAGRHFFGGLAAVDAHNARAWLKTRDKTADQKLLIPIGGDSVKIPIALYVGPKDVDVLETVGHDFARAVDLGWFGFIALPLLHVLELSHRFTGNYGVDIILLTLFIKVLFIPLTRTSYKSMQAMQKLQPQMTKIREKFKDNSEQMNKEIMELYKRHKVNPFGGCLPMVLQIPVFIGLYAALNNAVELRHAPFLFWINDLAAPDRLGTLQLPMVQHAGIPVMTLLMGISMFLQQWMSPSTGDPTQRQMMMVMPIMFTFMFVNFPAGLSLYWLVNNVLTIAQQFYMNRNKT